MPGMGISDSDEAIESDPLSPEGSAPNIPERPIAHFPATDEANEPERDAVGHLPLPPPRIDGSDADIPEVPCVSGHHVQSVGCDAVEEARDPWSGPK